MSRSDRYRIAISSIGSGVGQSVINSCRLSNLPLYTIGLGNNPFAYGAYDCDEYDYIPSTYSKDYIPVLIEKYKQHHMDLLIPGLDDEVYVLTRHKDQLEAAGINTILPGADIVELCRNKEKMTNELNPETGLFVKSYTPDNILDALFKKEVHFPLIAKPKNGFASRGVQILLNQKDLTQIQGNMIIQELAQPRRQDLNYPYFQEQIQKKINPQVSEISVQYVTDRNGDLIGKMASYNKLNHGVPIEVVPIQQEWIWHEMSRLIPVLIRMGMRGPFNIQGRLTDQGFKIFEMNPRFTGITYMRALMGFNEVEACIKSWLNITPIRPRITLNYGRFGIRQTADKSVALSRNSRISDTSRLLNSKSPKERKNVLITGANGFLGQTLCSMLSDWRDRYNIWALVRDKTKNDSFRPQRQLVKYFDYQDLATGNLSLGQIDTLIHCAFSRKNKSNSEIAQSLQRTSEILNSAAINQVPEIINISSQSVYDYTNNTMKDENSPPSPASPYAQAKYASELITSSLPTINRQTRVTSLRMASLCGGQPGMQQEEILAQFVKHAMNKETIQIRGGTQTFDKLDVRDAARALFFLLNTPSRQWKPTYNVATANPVGIFEIAQKVVDLAELHNGGFRSKILFKEQEVKLHSHLNADLFKLDTGWKPHYNLNQTILSLIYYFKKHPTIVTVKI